MRNDNVVPFDPVGRGGMARRGASDKNGSAPAEAEEIVLRCPSCACELRLEAEWLEGEAELLCGRCETGIALEGFRMESGAG